MSSDYLWNRTGPRDPEVVRLERLLGDLQPAELPPLALPARGRAKISGVGLAVTLASAAAILALVVLVWSTRPPAGSAVSVARVEGMPRVSGRSLIDRRTVQVGGRVETDERARAHIDLGPVGRLDIDPGTHLALVSARPGDYRVALDRGTIHAVIGAPPGEFFVETASSIAVDLGCVFNISVDARGDGFVEVTSGWVGLEWHGRESFVPAGAVCVTRPVHGPGTPYFEDTSDAFQQALHTIDTSGTIVAPGGSPAISAAVDRVIAEARARDAVTLWHLLARLDSRQRERVFDRLVQFVPAPDGVTREGVCSGRPDMLELWHDSLGEGTAKWWTKWKQLWPTEAPR